MPRYPCPLSPLALRLLDTMVRLSRQQKKRKPHTIEAVVHNVVIVESTRVLSEGFDGPAQGAPKWIKGQSSMIVERFQQ
jgi:hypothetical protein